MTLKFTTKYDDVYEKKLTIAPSAARSTKNNAPQLIAHVLMPRGKKLDVIFRFRQRFDDYDNKGKVIRSYNQIVNDPVVYFPNTTEGMKRAKALCNFAEKHAEKRDVLNSLRYFMFFDNDTQWKKRPLVLQYKLNRGPYFPGKKRRDANNHLCYTVTVHDTPPLKPRHVVAAEVPKAFPALVAKSFSSLDAAQNFCVLHYLEAYIAQFEKVTQRKSAERQ